MEKFHLWSINGVIHLLDGKNGGLRSISVRVPLKPSYSWNNRGWRRSQCRQGWLDPCTAVLPRPHPFRGMFLMEYLRVMNWSRNILALLVWRQGGCQQPFAQDAMIHAFLCNIRQRSPSETITATNLDSLVPRKDVFVFACGRVEKNQQPRTNCSCNWKYCVNSGNIGVLTLWVYL